jgi:cytochrome c oxidase assembly protein subunit 11
LLISPFSNTTLILKSPEQFRYDRSYSSDKDDKSTIKNKNRSTAILMFAVIIATIGLSYAAVPLYRMFCTMTGYGGTVKTGRSSAEVFDEYDTQKEIAEMNPIRIFFNSDVR